jgi:hypothetical protein
MFRINLDRAQFLAYAIGDAPGDIPFAIVISTELWHEP